MYNVGNLKTSIEGLLTGITIDTTINSNEALERAARVLVQKVDIPEASGKEVITLYGGVYDYPAPSLIFGGALTDFRPQGNNRFEEDYVYKQPVELFDRTKHLLPNGYKLTFETYKGVGRVRVATPKPRTRVVIDNMDDSADWTAGGSIASISEDDNVYYDVPTSLRFTLSGASAGTLTQTLSNSLDLSTYEGVGVAFLAIRTPNISNLTNIKLKLGSSASAYKEVTETEGFLGAWVVDEFLLIAFDFSGGTDTGTPDWSAIDYVQVTITHGATITNFRVGGLWISLPSPHTIHFQTAAIFLNSSGDLSKTITDDDTQIILNDAAYTLLEYEGAITIAEQGASGDLDGVAKGYKIKMEKDLIPNYQADNPSEEIRVVGSYYEEQ